MRKPHVFLLVATLLALIAYLLTPIFRVTVIGFPGMRAIQLVNFWFLLPVIFMVVVAIISLFGNKALSLGGAAVLSLVMLLFMFMIKDLVKGGNVSGILGSLGTDPTVTTITDLTLTFFINPAWGFILSLVLIVIGLIATAVTPEGSSSGSGISSRGQGNQGAGRSGVSPRSGSGSSYNKLY